MSTAPTIRELENIIQDNTNYDCTDFGKLKISRYNILYKALKPLKILYPDIQVHNINDMSYAYEKDIAKFYENKTATGFTLKLNDTYSICGNIQDNVFVPCYVRLCNNKSHDMVNLGTFGFESTTMLQPVDITKRIIDAIKEGQKLSNTIGRPYGHT